MRAASAVGCVDLHRSSKLAHNAGKHNVGASQQEGLKWNVSLTDTVQTSVQIHTYNSSL